MTAFQVYVWDRGGSGMDTEIPSVLSLVRSSALHVCSAYYPPAFPRKIPASGPFAPLTRTSLVSARLLH